MSLIKEEPRLVLENIIKTIDHPLFDSLEALNAILGTAMQAAFSLTKESFIVEPERSRDGIKEFCRSVLN